jgi:hypothetical protein
MITISRIILLVIVFLVLGIAVMISMKFGAHFGTEKRLVDNYNSGYYFDAAHYAFGKVFSSKEGQVICMVGY